MEDFIRKYYELLTGEYKSINLTRITDYEDFKLKQIQDSIEPFRQSEVFSTSIKESDIHVDIGFGGGFPILPLAYVYPEGRFIGLEARNKKVKVVSEIAEKLNLKNILLKHYRAEEVLIDIKATVSFKAVGKVNDFLSKINSDQKVKVFFYKAKNFYEIEKEQLKQAKKQWNIIEEKKIEIDGMDRLLIGFENKNKVGNNFNQLVRLSDLH